ncbi:MAE_28990/MAE_18760 family HEPN-like nuclease [Halomonas sp. HMF6819]|uniref:MAE_28990/MAE_18760 family HEPN-like nuclease n=1 Tax=Halomonas sp. HMF6819 TaxID=3373085 RepID=UPI0037A6A803
MKIRSADELLDFLAERKQRRKRELISLRHNLSSRSGKVVPHAMRTAILLAYAHWEGFVKEAARAYVHLVAYKSRPLSALSPNFRALACRQTLSIAQGAKRRVAPHIAVVEMMTENADQSIRIDANAAIDTESNLGWEVFKNICESVGVSYLPDWSIEGPFMDDLYENRCAIAHGELHIPTVEYAVEAVEFSLKWIENFSTEIENLALQEAYLSPSQAQFSQ